MRGKAGQLEGKVRDEGITPAYAGKSAEVLPSLRETVDHPRVCGEKTKKIP